MRRKCLSQLTTGNFKVNSHAETCMNVVLQLWSRIWSASSSLCLFSFEGDDLVTPIAVSLVVVLIVLALLLTMGVVIFKYVRRVSKPTTYLRTKYENTYLNSAEMRKQLIYFAGRRNKRQPADERTVFHLRTLSFPGLTQAGPLTNSAPPGAVQASRATSLMRRSTSTITMKTDRCRGHRSRFPESDCQSGSPRRAVIISYQPLKRL